MFKYTEFKAQKNFINRSWYVTRLILQCAILAFIPAAFNCIIQFIIHPISVGLGFTTHYNLTTQLDLAIPLVKPFVIIYLLAMPWWYVAPIFLYLINGKKNFHRFIICELTCEFVGLIFLIVLPTNCVSLRKPSILYNSNSIVDRMLRIIYSFTYDGCFPSFHVLNTWAIFIATREKDDDGKRHWIFGSSCGVWAILVCLSTLFIQQHWIMDVLFAIVITELVFALYKLHTKDYAIQKFTTWLNTGTKLEPIFQHNAIVNYRLVSKSQWKKYVWLWSVLMIVVIFLISFFTIIYFINWHNVVGNK